jgi:RNA polymerase sigma factor for flagellar operon FliA
VAPRDSDDRSPAASKGLADSPEVTARVRDALELVHAMALKIRASLHVTTPAEDLESFGNEGLLRAARSFDESRGVPFRCWATLRIRGAILDGVRSSGVLPRRVYRRMKEIEAADAVQEALVEEDAARPPADAADADARLSRYVATMATAMALASRDSSTRDIENVVDTTPSPEAQVARAELETAMRAAIAQIPEQEQHVVRRYYFDEASLDEIGKELGLSKSWTSRIHTRAVAAITRELTRQRAVP